MTRQFAPLAAIAAGIIGTLFAGLLAAGIFPNPSFFVRLESPTSLWVLLVGLALAWAIITTWWLDSRQQQKLKEERQGQAVARQRFVRDLQHQVRNPLQAITVSLARLEQEITSTSSVSSSLSNIRQQTERLTNLMENLQSLDNLETQPLDMTDVDIFEIIDEVREAAKLSPGHEHRKVRVDPQQTPWPLDPIEAERTLLWNALYNLIDNALKFSLPTAEVQIRAWEDGDKTIIEIKDEGQGIAPEDLPHVTAELYRSSLSDRVRGIPGSGLGLTLVQRVVDRHAGSLDIQSREGQGTIVRLRLPRQHNKDVPLIRAAGVSQELHRETRGNTAATL